MTKRQEIIATLLEWYESVLCNWADGTSSDPFGTARENKIIRHPSYVELERLLPLLRSAKPEVYWDIVQRYLYAPQKIVYRCPRCGPNPHSLAAGLPHHKDTPQPPFGEDIDHKHSGKLYSLRPTRVRDNWAISAANLEAGIAWLDENWVGEPFVPDFEARAA